jgi:hypothetical protein
MQLLQKDKNKLNESFINAQIDVLDNSGPFTRGYRGWDRIVVGFTTTCAISVHHH